VHGRRLTCTALAGSATHQAVEAGPDGSTFVSPSAVGADPGDSATTTSSPGTYFAALSLVRRSVVRPARSNGPFEKRI
jgi:hypothetical protein